jgi:hypothetical protein
MRALALALLLLALSGCTVHFQPLHGVALLDVRFDNVYAYNGYRYVGDGYWYRDGIYYWEGTWP